MKKRYLIVAISITLFVSSCFISNSMYFRDFIGFAPTKDVKHLNSSADELGIDASYWLAFECDDSTIDKIISVRKLQKSENEEKGLIGGLNNYPTRWWDTTFIFHSKPFKRVDEDSRLVWYLWHQPETNKAYFLTFDY